MQEGWALPLPHTTFLQIPVQGSQLLLSPRAPPCLPTTRGHPLRLNPPPSCGSYLSSPQLSSMKTKKMIWLPSVVDSGTYSSTEAGTTWASVSPYGKEDSWHTGRWGKAKALSAGEVFGIYQGFPLFPSSHISFSNSGKARPLFPTPTPTLQQPKELQEPCSAAGTPLQGCGGG